MFWIWFSSKSSFQNLFFLYFCARSFKLILTCACMFGTIMTARMFKYYRRGRKRYLIVSVHKTHFLLLHLFPALERQKMLLVHLNNCDADLCFCLKHSQVHRNIFWKQCVSFIALQSTATFKFQLNGIELDQ